MNDRLTVADLLQVMADMTAAGNEFISSSQLVEATGSNRDAIKRMLAKLVLSGHVDVTGKARATRYRLLTSKAPVLREKTAIPPPARAISTDAGPRWSPASLQLREHLTRPVMARTPVTYRREFVDNYKPNETFLLSPELAEELAGLGHLTGRFPAGTFARKVLEQLLIDLSWSSSHLEGNRYTLPDTEKLFKSGAAATDSDAIMLLNHKAAIEFIVETVPLQGLNTRLVCNVHAILMHDLLVEATSLGTIRTQVVNISGSTYIPPQVPAVLEEMFERIIMKAQQIKNPLEAAFFLWVNLAYLQTFEDGNKRVSRIAANIPLMLYNQAPVSFLDVDREDYALAMMGVYELCDVSMAVDLFEWTYRRSQSRYQAIAGALDAPDPFRVKYREALSEAVGAVVRQRQPLAEAISALELPAEDIPRFQDLLAQELNILADFNCARYRLGMKETQAWIDEGRPVR